MARIPGRGGVKGRSGPPGNMNAFKHGLASIQKRREEDVPTQHEENVRQQILDGLTADKGGDQQIRNSRSILRVDQRKRRRIVPNDAQSRLVGCESTGWRIEFNYSRNTSLQRHSLPQL